MKRELFIATIMSLFFSVVMSTIMILLFMGFTERFFMYLLQSAVVGFVISFPISLLLPMLLNKIADKLNLE